MPIFFVIDGEVTATYNGSAASIPAGGTPTTYNLSIGTAAGNRLVLAVVAYVAVGAIGSLTIGGVPAVKVAGVANGNSRVEFWVAAVPTGTTANFDLGSGTGTFPRLSVSSYSIYGAGSATPVATASDISSTYDAVLSNVPGKSLVVGGWMNSTGTSATWTNVTEDVDNNALSVNYSAGHAIASGFTPSYTVTVAPSGVATGALLAAAWSP